MPHPTMRALAARALSFTFLAFVFAVPASLAQYGGGREQARPSGPGTGNPDERFVPWRFVNNDSAPPKTPLVLYWLPASREEIDRSPLQKSQALLEDAERCVGFEIVLPDNAAMIARLDATGRPSAAVLVDMQGKVIRRVESSGRGLRVASVEQMVTEELSARDNAMYVKITEARQRARSGDKEGAISLFKQLWDERCLFPLAGRESQVALKDLGVIVAEPPAKAAADPYLGAAPTTTAPSTGHGRH